MLRSVLIVSTANHCKICLSGDSLSYHLGMSFSSYDQDNDVSPTNCAADRSGAWWFRDCHRSNLNGDYNNTNNGYGVNWVAFRGTPYAYREYTYSLSFTEMKIRPVNF